MTAPVAPPSRAVVVLAVLFVLCMTGIGAVALTSEAFQSTTVRNTTLAARVERLAVYNSAGTIRLAPSVDDRVHVHTQARFGLRAPLLIEESTSTGVLLQAHCDDESVMGCSVDYTIEVPPDFALRVQAGSGAVNARGLTGPVTLEVGSGAVGLFDLSGPVTVRAGEAAIHALGLTSDSIRVSNGAGNVSLDLLAAPSSLRVSTTVGDLDIAVPGEQRYRVDARGGVEPARIGIGVDQASPYEITASSEYGDIRIRPTGTDPDELPARPNLPMMPGQPPFPPEPPEPPEPPLPN